MKKAMYCAELAVQVAQKIADALQEDMDDA